MPYILTFQQPIIENKIADLSDKLAIKGKFNGFVTAILKLRKYVQIPSRLSNLLDAQNQKTEDITLIKIMIQNEFSIVEAPIKLTKKAIQDMLKNAMSGKRK